MHSIAMFFKLQFTTWFVLRLANKSSCESDARKVNYYFSVTQNLSATSIKQCEAFLPFGDSSWKFRLK